jgi:hypothetical protein
MMIVLALHGYHEKMIQLEKNIMKKKLSIGSVCVALIFSNGVSEVNKQTGDMMLSLPIAKISSHDLNLNVNLSYKSNIKTNQRSSWVGLGFDLDVPYIERVAIGSADEKAYSVIASDELLINNDCVQPGIFDLNKVWEPLLKPLGNSYQGEFEYKMTCSNTDIATGYNTIMNNNFISIIGSNCNLALTVNEIGDINVQPSPFVIACVMPGKFASGLTASGKDGAAGRRGDPRGARC